MESAFFGKKILESHYSASHRKGGVDQENSNVLDPLMYQTLYSVMYSVTNFDASELFCVLNFSTSDEFA